MPPYVFCVAGRTGTGKTTLVERLLPELVRRGYRVGTLIHDPRGFKANQAGQNTWGHCSAGAVATLIMGPERMALLRQDVPPATEQLIPLLGAVDLVLADGLPEAAWPKLEMHPGTGPLVCTGDPWLVAVAGPKQPRGCPVPWYHWDEIIQIAHVIENARSLGLAGR